MVQKRRRVQWAKAHLKQTVSKWKSVLWSDESKFDILVGNHRRHVLRAKEERDFPACHQRSAQKPASLMVWGCISVYGMGSLPILESTMNAERYIKGFRATYAPLQRTCMSAGQCKPHNAAITTAWLCSREPAVQILSPIENIWCIIKQKIHQKTTTNYSAAGNLYQARIGPIPTLQKTHNLDTDVFKLFE